MSKHRGSFIIRYIKNGKIFSCSFKTVSDFLSKDFGLCENPLAPKEDDLIDNIAYMGVVIHHPVNGMTVKELVSYVNKNMQELNIERMHEIKRRMDEEIAKVKGVNPYLLAIKPIDYKKHYERVGSRCSISEVNNFLSKTPSCKTFRKRRIKQGKEFENLKYIVSSGCKCECCGINGEYFIVEKLRDRNNYRIHLYATDAIGREVGINKNTISRNGEKASGVFCDNCTRINLIMNNANKN